MAKKISDSAFSLTFILIFTLFFNLPMASAQDAKDPVLLTIAGQEVRISEFLSVYHKNSQKDKVIDEKTLEEYLNLYINYKLKVKEAEDLGLDTTGAFKIELGGYRKQLSKPYLTDKNINERLLKEAYERKLEDVRVSHLLIRLNPNAEPKDTLLAYRKTMKIRKRLTRGEKFETVARQVSEDPSVKDNGGDLGYFTVFAMVYPFETAAYKTKVGEISKPVRTSFGYHLLKVTDKKDALGEVKVAHIMIVDKKGNAPEKSAIVKKKIDEVYKKNQNGESFESLVKQYSQDKSSIRKGGELAPFKTGRMVADFEKAVSELKNNGDVSPPVKTDYGWHIIKRINRKPVPAFEKIKGELKVQIARDSRANATRQVFITKIKKEYRFRQYLNERNDFYRVIDDTYFSGNWDAGKARALNKTMFTLLDKKFTQQDFVRYIQKNRSRSKNIPIKVVVDKLYNQFVDESCMAFEDGRLEMKYPDFKALIREYRDGILLFELTDRKVWSRAIKDTTGLRAFYANNKTNYMWDERLDASIYYCTDEIVAKQTKKLAKKRAKKGYTKEYIFNMINKEAKVLKIDDGKFLKYENSIIDSIEWQAGLYENIPGSKKYLLSEKDLSWVNVVFIYVNKKLNPTVKTLIESRGLVTADYQSYLEKEWIESLRKKYPVNVNRDAFSSIK